MSSGEMVDVIATPDALYELHERFNEAGAATALPVVADNGIFWMSYPYEDGDCLSVGMECGDPREHFEYHNGELFYPGIESDDPCVVYPLRVLWTPDDEVRA
jgi:hypothetical protein